MKIEIYNGTGWADETSHIKRGFQFVNRLDEELDSGVLILYNGIGTVYEPFSKVRITIGESIFNFYIDLDEVQSLSKDEVIYQHTISLIEPTKILERYDCDNLAFTQPLEETKYYMDDILTRINNVTPLEMLDIHEETRLFSISSTLLGELSNKVAPEFSFQQNTLLEVFNEVLKYDDSITRINDFGIIERDKFNELKESISLTQLTNKGQTINSEYYGSAMVMNGENIVSDKIDVFPNEINYFTFSSPEIVLTTDNMILKVPKPLYSTEKLVMLVKMAHSPTDVIFREIDITSHLFEFESYQMLQALDNEDTIGKESAIYYKKGENFIQGFGYKTPSFLNLWTYTAFQNILKSIEPVVINSKTYELSPSWQSSDYGTLILNGEIGFRLHYYSIDNQYIKLKQYKSLTHNNNLVLRGNQSSRVININRLLSNSKNTINRLGNEDVVIETIANTIDDCFQLGQYTEEKYVVSSVENVVFDETYIKSKAILTKNFNRLSSFIGVNQEYRQWEIPSTGIKRDLHYDEFVYISTGSISVSKHTIFETSGINILKNTFTPTITKKPSGVIVTPKYIDGEDVTNLGNLILGLDVMSGGNSVIFNWTFEDNKLAFSNVTQETIVGTIPVSYLEPIFYTKEDGSFDYLNMKIFNEDSMNQDMTEFVVNVSALPDKETWENNYGYLSKELYFYNTTDGKLYFGKYISGAVVTLDYYEKSEDEMKKIILAGKDETDTDDEVGYEKIELKKKNINDNQLAKYYDSFIANSGDFVVYKDTSETIGMTYQLHFVGATNVFIGESFINHNSFVQNEKVMLYLYTSSDEKYDYSSQLCKGDKQSDSFTGFSVHSLLNHEFWIERTIGTTVSSWGIGDNDGNLFIGCNGNTTFLYFLMANKL